MPKGLASHLPSLPPHVFREIFHYLSHAEHIYKGEYLYQRAYRPPLPQWTAVSRVCRFWREIALEYPRLWTEIPITKSIHPTFTPEDVDEVTSLFLSRSKRLPLCIRGLELFLAQDLGALKLVLPELARIESLDIGLTSRVFQLFAAQYLPARTLQTLHVRNHATAEVLHRFLLCLQTCTLKELTFSVPETYYQSLPWARGLFPLTLTRLVIGKNTFVRTKPWVVACALGCMLSLEELELHGMFRTSISSYYTDPKPVHHNTPCFLPRLKCLYLSACAGASCSFVDLLVVPALCQISLGLLSCSDAHTPSLVDLINKRIRCGEVNTLSIGSRGIGFYTKTPGPQPAPCHFYLTALPDIGTILPVLSILSLHTITVLSLHSLSPPTRPNWVILLSHTPNITHLTLTSSSQAVSPLAWSTESLLDVLLACYALRPTRVVPYPVLILPKLKTICMTGVDVDGRGTGTSSIGVVGWLCAVLRSRIESGVPVEELVLERCVNADKGAVGRLVEVVRVVCIE
ncbi:hypothetical protein BXZ70DRAFT_1012443 [Cristinia sonorae]|uniref:F-box domain-containing protein n=1 Tax=Cristinia sonorae TaxID=1940300 RepID=A0A8K0XKB9_9AGAR|nr:hypothetical protein BXZ70DRAFT_1012443 [Cristinia sonorae]